MSDILNFYEQQAKVSRSTIPWLAELQEHALRDFNRFAFPNRKIEDWKYTSMDEFLQKRFVRVTQESSSFAEISTKDLLSNLLKKSYTDAPIGKQIVIDNGAIVDADNLIQTLPPGVIVQPLLQAVWQNTDKIKPYFGKLLEHTHGFDALNMAALQTGLLIYLPQGVTIEDPIMLTYWQDIPNQAVHARNLIIAEEGSQASIIESFHGDDVHSYLTNTVTEIHMAANTKIVHYKVQCESQAAFHIGHLAVRQVANSQFDSHLLSVGAKLGRSDLTIQLEEARANCLMNGIYIPINNQHMDHHTIVHHLVPDCSSFQDYKGILTGRSRAVFNGKVIVAKQAVHTKASQQNKNLLLSSLAEIDTKPQLNIFADDVICSHGATVGQLDEEALFYMTSRGIERQDAIHYLIRAFAADNLRFIPHHAVASWMSKLIEQQLNRQVI